MSLNLGSLMATIGANIQPLQMALRKANQDLNTFSDQAQANAQAISEKFRGLNKIGESMSSVGKKMTLGLTLPLAAAGIAAGKLAMDWEEGMAKINTTAQLSKEGLKQLSNEIYKLGAEAGADLTKVPQAFEGIISNVGDAALSMDIFKSSLQGAKAGFTEINVVSGALAMSLSAIGKDGAKAEDVLNTLFAAKRVGAGEFADFANYVPGLIASGKALGVGYKDVAGAFAYMTSKGNDAASSAMLLQNAFSAMGKGEIQKGLAASGVKIFDTEGKMRGLKDVMTEVGGVMSSMNDEEKTAWLEKVGLKDMQAKQAFMVLSSDVSKLGESLSATANASGELETALALAKNPAQNMEQAMSNLKGAAIGFGQILLPAINSIISAFSRLMGFIVGLSDTQKQWIITIGGVVAAIGPMVFIIGKVILAVQGIAKAIKAVQLAMTFLAANPFTIWIVAIGAAVTAIVLLWKNCETFRAVVKFVAESAAYYFQLAWIGIKQGAELMWLGIKTYFTAIPKLASAVFNVIKRVMSGESIGDAFKDEFGKIITDVTDQASTIKDKYKQEFDSLEAPNYQKILAAEKASEAGKAAGEKAGAGIIEGVTEVVATSGVGAGVIPKLPLTFLPDLRVDDDLDFEDAFEGAVAPAVGTLHKLDMSLLAVKGGFEAAKGQAALFGETFDAPTAKLEALRAELEKLSAENLPENSAALAALGGEYRKLKTEIDSTAQSTIKIGEMISQSLGSAFTTIGESLGGLIAGTSSVDDALKGMLGVVLDFGAEFGKALIAVGIGKLALDKLITTPGGAVLAIAAGVALTALVGFAKSKLAGGLNGGGGEGGAPSMGSISSVPALAGGGLAYGPTLAMVGDNVGAYTNPEYIGPVSGLSKYMNNDNGGGTNLPEVIRLIVSGENLEAVLNTRQKRSKNLR